MARSMRVATRKDSGRPIVLFDNFTTPGSPAESIRRPGQVYHQQLEFAGNPRRTSDNDDRITDLQRFLSDTPVAQLRSSSPFNRPALDCALRIGSLNSHVR